MISSRFKLDGVFVQSLLAFAVKGLGAIAVFSMNLVLARELGAEQSGYFFLGFTVIMFLGAVTRCGFDKVVLRYTAARSHGDWQAIRCMFWRGAAVTFVCATLAAILLWAASGFLAESIFNKPQFGSVLASIAPSIISFALLWLVAHSLQGIGQVSAAIIAMNVAANVALILSVWFFGIRLSGDAALVYTGGSFLVLILVLFYWHVKTRCEASAGDHSIPLRAMFVSAWPLWIVLLMSQLIQWTGQFVGGAYLPPEEIA